MWEHSLEAVNLDPLSNGCYDGTYTNISKAARSEEFMSTSAASSNKKGASILNHAQSAADDTSPSASSLFMAPVCRQFWRAGDYFEDNIVSKLNVQSSKSFLKVHPKFLHTNATSHKWAFGAFAELLDNSIDEIQNGATFVIVDKISNPRDGSPALLFQDDGGGMGPNDLRCCMSFGYSDKNSKSLIGKYGNGFKTSSMRLGADVIVFSRHVESNRRITLSVGLLSYTYLKWANLDRIVVPVVDYELNKSTGELEPMKQYTAQNVQSNLSILLQWSPFSTEKELMKQFDNILTHGTKVIVYNLWESAKGVLEFDFETDPEDVLLTGLGRRETGDPKLDPKLVKSEAHIGSRFHYSLRVYVSILYLRVPQKFTIILRGTAIKIHNIADDLKYIEYILYKPTSVVQSKVVTTIGFLKEAPDVNIHGFNVYHKNRLILPFWKVVKSTLSKGRGVVGVLEANFVEPTHNKQDFEKTSIFEKLEQRLKDMTWEYWDYHCGLVGYNVRKVPPQVPNSGNGSMHSGPGPGNSTQPTGMKRLRRNYSAESGHAKRIARTGPSADVSAESGHAKRTARTGPSADVGLFTPVQIQECTPAVNIDNQACTISDENRRLHKRCGEHERSLEELGKTVEQLRNEIKSVKDEYAQMQLGLAQL